MSGRWPKILVGTMYGAAVAAAGCQESISTAASRPAAVVKAPAPAGRRAAPRATFDPNAPAEVEVKRPLMVHPLINGHDVGWFIVDTGASGSVISPDAAVLAGMSAIESRTVVGAGTFEAPGRWCEQLTLGPARLANIEFTEFETAFMSPRSGPQVAGIIGADLFRLAVVELDMGAPAMRIYDPARYWLKNGRWELIQPGTAGAAVRASIENNTAGWFLLDTGGEFGIAVDEEGAEKLGLLDGRPMRRRWARGVGGMDEGREGEVSSLEIGGQRLSPAPLRVFGKGKLPGAREGIAGLIGWRALSRVVVVMDWARGRVAVLARDGVSLSRPDR